MKPPDRKTIDTHLGFLVIQHDRESFIEQDYETRFPRIK